MLTEEQNELVESAAEMLYGLIHVRYILTSKGMNAMLEKYKKTDFGRCPRVYCSGQPCLPVGQSDIPRTSTVKIYCPKCEDVYYPRSKYQGTFSANFKAYERSSFYCNRKAFGISPLDVNVSVSDWNVPLGKFWDNLGCRYGLEDVEICCVLRGEHYVIDTILFSSTCMAYMLILKYAMADPCLDM
eukprot:Gb_06061 [translate_table: standard]